jgi:hypothetical protein
MMSDDELTSYLDLLRSKGWRSKKRGRAIT